MKLPKKIYVIRLQISCILFIAAFNFNQVQSQTLSNDYIKKHWTVDDGLPVNEIVSIAQTQDGYIWLATFDGIVRFDGDQFTIFNTGNIDEFPTNRFIDLKVDRHNNLWIVTEKVQNNEMLIAYHGGQFTVFGPEHGVLGDISLQLDHKGNLLVGSDNGAFYYDGKMLQAFGDELKEKSVRKIAVDSENTFWFATDHGVFKKNKDEWVQYTEKDGLDTNNTFAVYVDQLNKIWIGTETDMYGLENNTIKLHAVDWPEPIFNYLNIYENPKKPGQIYLVNDGQYIYTNENEGLFFIYPNETYRRAYELDLTINEEGVIWMQSQNELFKEGELIYTGQTRINHLFTDQTGNMWVAQRDGLTQIKPKSIKAYDKNISNVYALIKDSDELVLATQNHLDVFQLQGDRFFKVSDKIGIPSPRSVYSLYPSTDGFFWIGMENGVYRWDKKNQAKLLRPPINENNSSGYIPQMADVKGIQEDTEGNMWFGGNTGIHKLDKNGEWYHIGKIDASDILGVRMIYKTRDSTLWFGTNGNGLLYLKNGELSQFNTDNGLSGNIIRSMYEDEEGIIWVGTEGWGLNRIERANISDNNKDQITIFGKKDGLFDTVIHQILEDDQNRLWMNSNRGIFWVDKSELTAFTKGEISSIYSFFYSEQDGLPGREGNGGVQPAGFKSKNGELWFPMQGGVVNIDPKQVETSSLNVFIENINVANDTWHIGETEEKIFQKGQRDLQINYAALDFSTNPTNIRYRYKLEGSHDNWIEAGNRKEAIYNNLDPGTYTFKVMANNGGGWSVNQASLKIVIPHYFHETYWFYGILVLLTILIINRGVHWRIQILKKKGKELEAQVVLRTQDLFKEKEETERQKEIATEALVTVEKQAAALQELDKAKSRFFTNISHEFRTPLTLIIGPLEHHIEKLKEDLHNDVEDVEIALRNSKRLLQLVNQILEVARLESGHTRLNIQLIDILAVIKPLCNAFKSLAERNNIHFSIELPDKAVMAYIDPDMIEKAVVNLMSNAFKFTPKQGFVQIKVIQKDNSISIAIKDSGPGISKEQQQHIFERFYQVNESVNINQASTGIGLSLVYELITLHGGTIELNSELGLGSEFRINLLTGKEHLENHQVNLPKDEHKKAQSGDADNLIDEQAKSIMHDYNLGKDVDYPMLLIVEDNTDIRRYISKYLSSDYRIIEAENGLEGFEMVQKFLPDLVISDVMMPISDGYELCQKIKQHSDFDFIPVILLTAKAETSQKIEGLELGADDYIVKPFEINELKARVQNLILSRQKLKERLADTKTLPLKSNRLGWVDTPFINRVKSTIEQHISDEDFSVSQLAEAVEIGRTTLYSRVVELTGKTPSEMIKLTRLHQAAQLLKEDAGNISEIAYATGFKSISHFSKTFKIEFELSPTEYKKDHIKV